MKIETFVGIQMVGKPNKGEMVLRKFNKRADRMTQFYLTNNTECSFLSLNDLDEEEEEDEGLRYEDICVAVRRMMNQMSNWADTFSGRCQATQRDTKFTRSTRRIFKHLKGVLDRNLGCV